MEEDESPRERRWWIVGYVVVLVILAVGAARQLLELFG
jgi:hypothetical protein